MDCRQRELHDHHQAEREREREQRDDAINRSRLMKVTDRERPKSPMRAVNDIDSSSPLKLSRRTNENNIKLITSSTIESIERYLIESR